MKTIHHRHKPIWGYSTVQGFFRMSIIHKRWRHHQTSLMSLYSHHAKMELNKGAGITRLDIQCYQIFQLVPWSNLTTSIAKMYPPSFQSLCRTSDAAWFPSKKKYRITYWHSYTLAHVDTVVGSTIQLPASNTEWALCAPVASSVSPRQRKTEVLAKASFTEYLPPAVRKTGWNPTAQFCKDF